MVTPSFSPCPFDFRKSLNFKVFLFLSPGSHSLLSGQQPTSLKTNQHHPTIFAHWEKQLAIVDESLFVRFVVFSLLSSVRGNFEQCIREDSVGLGRGRKALLYSSSTFKLNPAKSELFLVSMSRRRPTNVLQNNFFSCFLFTGVPVP